jgi:hypothetical protein
MQGSLQNPETAPAKPKISVPAIAAAGAALVAVVTIFWLLFMSRTVHAPQSSSESLNLAMTPAEQQYVKNIQVGNIALSRAENFLHQEVTILSGEVYNAGNESVSGLRFTTTYFDDMNQTVLKETRAVLGLPEPPLSPGERRTFEISFDHVPNSWNMQQPSVVVTYLQLRRR